jgi:hypothetical protein
VEAIHDRYPGGWSAFIQEVPNQTLCSDNELARIGFMTPEDCNIYVDGLEHHGIISIKNEKSVDIVVADQVRGLPLCVTGLNLGELKSILGRQFQRHS